MLLEQIITIGLTAFVTTIAMNHLSKSSEQEVVVNEMGYTVLRMNKLYKVLAWVCIGVALSFILVAIYLHEEGMYIISFLMLLFFGGFGFVLLMYYENHKVEYDENFIKINNWKGEEEALRWDEIETVEYNKLTGHLKLHYKNKKRSIHEHLVGFKMLLNKLEEKKKIEK